MRHLQLVRAQAQVQQRQQEEKQDQEQPRQRQEQLHLSSDRPKRRQRREVLARKLAAETFSRLPLRLRRDAVELEQARVA